MSIEWHRLKEEKPPQEPEQYLVYSGDGKAFDVDWYTDEFEGSEGRFTFSWEDITHWAYLEPPREEG